ncbi:hypothetical protein C7Y71_006015 [Pseudoprevotella muciniphila]|uniref:Uncharacterized protein n=1 Tax=Pseudoprevotella muciniphila TaxID=2133944 RepID=A0A5P8E6P1_9BACT|nr:hypothetical protein [Pseudoprevotella muciniphila]QFQ12604.1 hypothetical protein C7Y71_006015 [Pseudoprevotella muciniphila]
MKEFLSQLSKEELMKYWIDYGTIQKAASYTNPLTMALGSTINEGLIQIYPIDKTIEYVRSYFGLHNNQIKEINADNGIKHILVVIPSIGNNIELIKKAMDYCGYYLGFPKEDNIPINQLVTLQFEPKFQNNVSNNIRKEETTLLHLTPYYNLKKIQNIGFSPRLRNELFNYPSRIYFLRGSMNRQEMIDIGIQLNNANNSLGNTGKYALITLDVSAIPQEKSLFLDPNYPYGIFTMNNITSDVIINVEEIQF